MEREATTTRLWLDFVNSDEDAEGRAVDMLRSFAAFVSFLEAAGAIDGERSGSVLRRAEQQPAGASAALLDARRVRAALRAMAERGRESERVRADALEEINRVLGRSAGTRRIDAGADGVFVGSFVPVGEAFASLMIPIVESAAESLMRGDLARIRKCRSQTCHRVFLDETRNGARRWCDMSTCGNRAKSAKFRKRRRDG
jgi:predicted RNA-binding Zn ribbon-like protein